MKDHETKSAVIILPCFNRTNGMRNPTDSSNNFAVCTQVVEDKKGLVFPVTGLSKSSPQEGWLGPLQQMGRHVIGAMVKSSSKAGV